ncbi:MULTISPECIES: phage holin family protein [Pedobacter]|uniref:phage holin family protein n=1 Tax=Pedobacter TaxID=84567 RepID=UPI00210D7495|nr:MULTISPECIES: phage holin family protein [unclassified Pedobacter]
MMQEEEIKEKRIEDLYEDVKVYLETKLEYMHLMMVKKVAKIFADIVTNTVVLVCFILAFLFGSVTLALYLSDVFGSFTAGFGAVSLIYLLLALIVFFTKDKYIEKGIINVTVRRYFTKLDEDDGNDEKKI